MFQEKIGYLTGARSILKQLGYRKELLDSNGAVLALKFPDDLDEPDREVVAVMATELCMARFEASAIINGSHPLSKSLFQTGQVPKSYDMSRQDGDDVEFDEDNPPPVCEVYEPYPSQADTAQFPPNQMDNYQMMPLTLGNPIRELNSSQTDIAKFSGRIENAVPQQNFQTDRNFQQQFDPRCGPYFDARPGFAVSQSSMQPHFEPGQANFPLGYLADQSNLKPRLQDNLANLQPGFDFETGQAGFQPRFETRQTGFQPRYGIDEANLQSGYNIGQNKSTPRFKTGKQDLQPQFRSLGAQPTVTNGNRINNLSSSTTWIYNTPVTTAFETSTSYRDQRTSPVGAEVYHRTSSNHVTSRARSEPSNEMGPNRLSSEPQRSSQLPNIYNRSMSSPPLFNSNHIPPAVAGGVPLTPINHEIDEDHLTRLAKGQEKQSSFGHSRLQSADDIRVPPDYDVVLQDSYQRPVYNSVNDANLFTKQDKRVINEGPSSFGSMNSVFEQLPNRSEQKFSQNLRPQNSTSYRTGDEKMTGQIVGGLYPVPVRYPEHEGEQRPASMGELRPTSMGELRPSNIATSYNSNNQFAYAQSLEEPYEVILGRDQFRPVLNQQQPSRQGG